MRAGRLAEIFTNEEIVIVGPVEAKLIQTNTDLNGIYMTLYIDFQIPKL